MEMESIKIRRISGDDLEDLVKISRQTFYETFSEVNTEENMKKYLDESLSAEKLRSELNNENSVFYFAETAIHANLKPAPSIIGYLKLNFGLSQTELKDEKAIEIERIYVLKEYQGKKVGQLLYEKAIEIAWERNADFVWLGVWEENQKAINFYKKNGFIEFDQHKFMLGDDEQTDLMMKLWLNPA
ncbi:MAG: GNAT family N-acetyltransferase [Flavitalea sp.]